LAPPERKLKLISYIEKVREPDKGEETDALLGRAETDFDKWLE